MKQAIYIIGGAIACGFLAYLLLGEVATWYGPRYIQSDEDISAIYLIFLGVVVGAVIIGGIGGRVLFRNLKSRSSRRTA